MSDIHTTDLTAVVTGGGSRRGIGRATAHALAAAGWNVAILDLDEGSRSAVAASSAASRTQRRRPPSSDLREHSHVSSRRRESP